MPKHFSAGVLEQFHWQISRPVFRNDTTDFCCDKSLTSQRDFSLRYSLLRNRLATDSADGEVSFAHVGVSQSQQNSFEERSPGASVETGFSFGSFSELSSLCFYHRSAGMDQLMQLSDKVAVLFRYVPRFSGIAFQVK